MSEPEYKDDTGSDRQKRLDELGITEEDIHDTMLPPDIFTKPSDSGTQEKTCAGCGNKWHHDSVWCPECAIKNAADQRLKENDK